jgi:hypothetical protein
MKLAIIGSRGITELGDIPECSTIISGGAKGVDQAAEQFAKKNDIPLVVYLPEYKIFGRGAPLIRNKMIVDVADFVLAFWDGKSRGTKSVIDYCKKQGKPHEVRLVDGIKVAD